MILALIAAAFICCVVSPTLALLVGGGIRLADRLESPAVRVGGEDPAHSGARHLRVIR